MIPLAPAAHRIGAPQPLTQYIAQMMAAYQGAVVGAAATDHPDFPWHPALDTCGITPPDPLELAAEIATRLGAVIAGHARWQAHPYRRASCRAPVIWQEGSTQLRDYAPNAASTAPVVLVLPSLVNRAYILDLTPENSAMLRLRAAGLHPYLLDWGAPTATESAYAMQDYANRALAALAQIGPASLLGYCMGGTLASGIAARHPTQVRSLTTLGAPWDFSAGGGIRAQLRLLFGQENGLATKTTLQGLTTSFGHIPAALFQSLFAAINPLAFATKFRRFTALAANSDAETLFVAVEDWLADGVAMAAPAAQNLLLDWHIHNEPGRDAWQLSGQAVRAAAITCPSFIIAGAHDTIAPPDGVLALAAKLPAALRLVVETGHVGLITSARVAGPLWDEIARFHHNLAPA